MVRSLETRIGFHYRSHFNWNYAYVKAFKPQSTQRRHEEHWVFIELSPPRKRGSMWNIIQILMRVDSRPGESLWRPAFAG